MPTLDPSRATFVQQEYRYQTRSDSAIKAVYKNAQSIDIETSFSAAVADGLAQAIFDETKTYDQAISLTFQGILTADDFSGGPNRYTLTAAQFAVSGKTMRVTGVKVDYVNNLTTVQMRG